MLPGPDEIFICPNCEKKFYTNSLVSGNTFGADFWSDGSMDAPMMPDIPAYILCPHCKAGYWRENLKVFETGKKWGTPECPKYSKPDIESLKKELENPDLDYEHKKWLLLRIIHTANFDRRYSKESLNEEAREAMKLFINTLPKKYPPDKYLIVIDFYREMGDYSKAVQLLNEFDYKGDRQEKLFLQQLKWIEQKNSLPMKYELAD